MASASRSAPRSPTNGSPPVEVSELPALVAAIEATVRSLPQHDALEWFRRIQERFAIAETEVLAAAFSEGAGHRETQRLAAANGARSKQDVGRRQRQIEAVAANPSLAASVKAGELTSGQFDAIAHASSRTSGAAATDAEWLGRIKDLTADQAHRAANDYIDRYERDDLESEHERQRRLRRVHRRRSADGLHQLVAEGDKASIDLTWQQLESAATTLYRLDGGRDVSPSDHPRTRQQRLFDALVERVTAPADGTKRQSATVVITTTLDNLLAGAPEPADLLGSGPLPRELFARFLEDAELVGLIFGGDGQPLRLGRRVRHATAAQKLALSVRDRGCHRCGAHPNACDAHHVIGWHAPARGRSDIEAMALACEDCHRQLHHDEQTLEWDPIRHQWTSRPASPDELSPHRPPSATRRRPIPTRPADRPATRDSDEPH